MKLEEALNSDENWRRINSCLWKHVNKERSDHKSSFDMGCNMFQEEFNKAAVEGKPGEIPLKINF